MIGDAANGISMKNRLKALRTGRAWTQDVLAGQLGVSRQTVNAIENGRHTPNLPVAFRIARLFGVAAEDVFELGDDLFSPTTSAGTEARPLDLSTQEIAAQGDVAILVPPSYYTTLERTLREAAEAARAVSALDDGPPSTELIASLRAISRLYEQLNDRRLDDLEDWVNRLQHQLDGLVRFLEGRARESA